MRVFDSGREPLGPGRESERTVTCTSDAPIHPGELGYLYGLIEYRDIFAEEIRTTTFGYEVNLLTQTAYRLTEYPEYNKNM